MTSTEAAGDAEPARGEAVRLLFLLTSSRVGGAEMAVLRMMSELDKSRVCAVAATLGVEGELTARFAADGIRLHALGMRSRMHARRSARALGRLLRSEAIEGVYLFGLTAAVVGNSIARIGGSRFTIFAHRGAIRERGAKLALKRWLSNRATLAIYNSRSVRDSATAIGFRVDHSRVIHNGVDIAGQTGPQTAGWMGLCGRLGLEDPAAAAAHAVVVMAASLRAEKDYPTFLRAAQLVSRQRPGVRFLIVGDGPLKSDLTRLRDELGLSPYVYFAGYRSDVLEIVRAADVVGLSSRTESLPNSIIEAMGVGKPVVATAVGGVPELVEDGRTGHLVSAGDHERFARRLAELLEDGRTREEFGRAARARVESEFTTQRMARQTEDAVIDAARAYGET